MFVISSVEMWPYAWSLELRGRTAHISLVSCCGEWASSNFSVNLHVFFCLVFSVQVFVIAMNWKSPIERLWIDDSLHSHSSVTLKANSTRNPWNWKSMSCKLMRYWMRKFHEILELVMRWIQVFRQHKKLSANQFIVMRERGYCSMIFFFKHLNPLAEIFMRVLYPRYSCKKSQTQIIKFKINIGKNHLNSSRQYNNSWNVLCMQLSGYVPTKSITPLSSIQFCVFIQRGKNNKKWRKKKMRKISRRNTTIYLLYTIC